MSRVSIAVPDVIGLTFATAYSIGTSAGLVVKGQAPDGRPIAPDSEGIVVEQSPASPGTSKPGHVLSLRVGRGDGGSRDPEPRRPDPLVRSDLGDYRDPDADLELIPV